MKIKTKFLSVCAAALLTLPALASIQLSVSFSPILQSGTDPNGFENSTWTLVYNSSQSTYDEPSGGADVSILISESASLTVTGADNADYNDTFAITDSETTNFGFVPDAFGNAFFGTNTDGSGASFSFGAPSIAVNGLVLRGAVQASPLPGDPVEMSHWSGNNVQTAGSLSVGSGNFSIPLSSISAIPEPVTFSYLFAGLVALALMANRRRK